MSAPSPRFASNVRSAVLSRLRRLRNLQTQHDGRLHPHQIEEVSDLEIALVAMDDPRVAERMISSWRTS